MDETVKYWYYLDSRFVEHGPFETEQILGWYTGGYFKKDVRIKASNSREYISLEDLIKKNGATNPFEPKIDIKTIMHYHEDQLNTILAKIHESDLKNAIILNKLGEMIEIQNMQISVLSEKVDELKNIFNIWKLTVSKNTIQQPLVHQKNLNSNSCMYDDKFSENSTDDESESSGFVEVRSKRKQKFKRFPKNQWNQSYKSDGIWYYLYLKSDEKEEFFFVMLHMYSPKDDAKNGFNLKMNAVEKMSNVFKKFNQLIENTDSRISFHEQIELAPKITIQTTDPIYFLRNSVSITSKHIKESKSGRIEFSYDGAYKFGDLLDELLEFYNQKLDEIQAKK